MDYAAFFVRDPQICGGQLTVKGTRVTVRTILASLAEGASEDEILADFPTLKREAPLSPSRPQARAPLRAPLRGQAYTL